LPTVERQLRLLILRLGAMGDILHALPAVTALRAAHPEWFIGWAVEPRWRSLLAAESKTGDAGRGAEMPLVDRLHRIPAKQWGRAPLTRRTLSEVAASRRELRAEQYDVCIDLQGAVRSAWIGRWARPKRMIGEAHPREAIARWLFNERIATRGVHVIEQALEVAAAAAHEQLTFIPPLFPHDPAAEAWCDALQLERHPFVLVNPGAGWGAKRWPAERYGEVARALSGQGFEVLVNAGPAERELAEAMVVASGGRARRVDPTLGQLIALTSRATLMIAGDTGPLHLACALGKPVVGIFGPTDPARNGPFGCAFRVLRHPESKRDHSRRSEPEAGLLTITAADVLRAVKELLEEKRQ
jgi:heptosyltransferase-1